MLRGLQLTHFNNVYIPSPGAIFPRVYGRYARKYHRLSPGLRDAGRSWRFRCVAGELVAPAVQSTAGACRALRPAFFPVGSDLCAASGGQWAEGYCVCGPASCIGCVAPGPGLPGSPRRAGLHAPPSCCGPVLSGCGFSSLSSADSADASGFPCPRLVFAPFLPLRPPFWFCSHDYAE